MQIGITLINNSLVEEEDYFFCRAARADLLVLKT